MTYAGVAVSDSDVMHATDEVFELENRSTQWSEVVSVFDLSFRKIEVLKSLLAMQSLSENWDSYGSQPPSTTAIDVGCTFVIRYLLDDDPMPRIIPVSGSGIQLAWKKQDKEITLDIFPDGRLEYVKSCGDEIIEVDEQFALDWGKIRSFLDWVR